MRLTSPARFIEHRAGSLSISRDPHLGALIDSLRADIEHLGHIVGNDIPEAFKLLVEHRAEAAPQVSPPPAPAGRTDGNPPA